MPERVQTFIHSQRQTTLNIWAIEKLRLILKSKEKVETFLPVSESVERDNEEKLPPPTV
jgi:hypothetical protein